MATGTPFGVEAAVTLAFTAGGGFTNSQAQFDTARLMNTLRIPIEVTEIHVTVDSIPAGAGVIRPEAFIYLEGKFGKHYVTDGPVPISVLAPYRLGSSPIDAFSTLGAGINYVATRRIILPRPLYVERGMGFTFTASMPRSVFLDNTTVSFTATVRVALIGRFIENGSRRPEFNHVPMISHVELTQTKLVSFETDLRNPLSAPLHVHRLIGAIPSWAGPPDILSNINTDNLQTIEMKFPDSSPLSEDALNFLRGPFGQMRVCPIAFDMPANSRIRAQIQAMPAEDTAILKIGHQVALFGTRPEVIS